MKSKTLVWVLLATALTGMTLGQPSQKKEPERFQYSVITSGDPAVFNGALATTEGEVLPSTFSVTSTAGHYNPAVYSILVRKTVEAEADKKR